MKNMANSFGRRVTAVAHPERHAREEKRSGNTGRKKDLINFQIRHWFQWGCRVLTGWVATERERREKGGKDEESEEL